MSVGLIYCFLVLVWGSTWIAIRWQLGEVAPEISIFYRFLLASCLLWSWSKFKKFSLSFNLREHISLFFLGLFLFSINYLLIYHATNYLVTGMVSVIFSTASLLNIFNNALFFRQKPEKKLIFGALLGIAGIASIFWNEITHINPSSQIFLGVVLSFLGTYSFSLGNIVSKKIQQKGLSIIPTTTLAMFYGTLIVLGYLLFADIPFSWSNHPLYVGSLLYTSIVGSAVAFLYYLHLIGRIGPEKTGYIFVFMPLIGLIGSSLFEGYKWKITDLFSFVLIFLGNILLLIPKPLRKT